MGRAGDASGSHSPEAPDTRFSPLYAPNGLIIGEGALAAEIGVDVLQNGGTAVDAIVATLGVGLVEGYWSRDPMLLSGIVDMPAEPQPLSIRSTARNLHQLLAVLQTVLLSFGSRSLYDLLRPATSYIRVGLPGKRPSRQDEERALAFERSEWIEPLPEPVGWREAWRLEAGDLALFGSPAPRLTELDDLLRRLLDAPVSSVRGEPDWLIQLIETTGRFEQRTEGLGEELEEPARSGAWSLSATAVDHRGMTASIGIGGGASPSCSRHLIIRRRDRPVFVLAASDQRPGALAQVLMNRFVRELPLQASVEAPRIRPSGVNGRPTSAGVEEGFPRGLLEALKNAGVDTTTQARWAPQQGVVQAVEINRQAGMLIGATDPRGRGQASGY